jgi:hypothetical protein
MIEIRGNYIRAQIYRHGDNIFLEVTDIYDPGYESPVVVITSEAELEKVAEELIEEFTRIVRELVRKISKTASIREIQSGS